MNGALYVDLNMNMLNMLIFMHNDEMSMFSLSCPDHKCITEAHMTDMEVFKQRLLAISVMPQLAIFRMKSHDCRHSYEMITDCVDGSTLTETAVIGKVSQEVVTFLSLTPAD